MTALRTGQTTRRRPVRLAALATAALLLLTACGGDEKESGSTARNPSDPRRVPTATVPAQRGTPLAALEVAAPPARRTPLPDTYQVRSGDTLGGIATELGISADDLSRANPGIDPRGLRPGQELRIPRLTPTPTATATRPATTATATATATGTPGRSPTPAPSPTGTPGRTATVGPTPTASPGASPTRTATPSATATPTAGGAGTYTVQSGDTGCSIAGRLGVSVTALAQANGTTVEGLGSIRPGQVLQTPRATGESPGC